MLRALLDSKQYRITDYSRKYKDLVLYFDRFSEYNGVKDTLSSIMVTIRQDEAGDSVACFQNTLKYNTLRYGEDFGEDPDLEGIFLIELVEVNEIADEVHEALEGILKEANKPDIYNKFLALAKGDDNV